MSPVYFSNGKPLLVDGLVAMSEECCCGGGESTCNDCDPPIPTKLYATLPSDLTGDFAPYADNAYEINWTEGCHWESSSGEVTLAYGGGFWDLNLLVGGNASCLVSWAPLMGECDPTGSYPFNICDDSACSQSSCDSFGAADVSDQP